MKKLKMSSSVLLLIAIAGLVSCSSFGKRKATSVDNGLIIPPSLKVPSNLSNKTKGKQVAKANYQKNQQPTRTRISAGSNQNYYIIVGTYPDQNEALDTFVRLSSIGLDGATMESRMTKSGRNLHMVRLGPYNNQGDIDKVKDSLTNDGLSQFKVVKN